VQSPGVPAQVTQMPPAKPAAAPIVAPEPAGPAVPPGTRIVLKATADAWMTVKQKMGPPLMSKLMHAGDSWPVPPDRTDLMMTTGNAGGTEVDVDGTAVARAERPGAEEYTARPRCPQIRPEHACRAGETKARRRRLSELGSRASPAQ
jgi:cytoskeleton protein RodZ